MQSTVLVTGGAGYIGSHMVKMLSQSGYKVIVLDNLSRGYAEAAIHGELITADLLDRTTLNHLLVSHSIKAVLHFAAFAYVGESVKQPDRYYRNNLLGSLNLLDSMVAAGVKQLVYSSTCATYGINGAAPISENTPQQPINPYGRSKLMVEHMLSDYAQAFGLNSIALRYFNAAGCDPDGELGEQHEPETHLIPLILKEALRVKLGGNPKETKLRVFGTDFMTSDGTCVRDYIHVTDLCSAHLCALRQLQKCTDIGFEAYNLGNDVGFTVKEVINTAREVTGIPINFIEQDRRPGDPDILISNSQKAKIELGWEPRHHKLNTIIHSAWNWMLTKEQRAVITRKS